MCLPPFVGVFIRRFSIVYLALAAPMTAPADEKSPTKESSVTSMVFGKTPRGDEVTLYTLTNQNGTSVSIMDYGATIVKIVTPDRAGKMADVVLGFDKLTPYFHQTEYFGAVVGRYGNRIARGRFTLDHVSYQLPINNPPNSLHGGTVGFDKHVWKREEVDPGDPAVRFSLLSPDGDQGYPGNLFASVTYTLNEDNQLRIAYSATTDKPTIINLTNHAYYNLAGAGNGTVLGHLITLHADNYTPVDATLIPTGQKADVEGTAFDLRKPTAMGAHLKETGGKPVGYDHNFILNKGFLSEWALAAEVEEPTSGRTLKVYTDQPGVQFYTGNFLNGTLKGKGGKIYPQYGGFCLETQHFPDSPNEPDFPTTLLVPGETYETSTLLEFGTK